MRRIGTAALVIVAVATLTACTADDGGGPSPTPSSSSSGPFLPSVDPSTLNPVPPGVIDEDTGETYAPQPVPEWDDESRASVIAAAETAMRAYGRPDLAFEEWWAGVSPLLDQKASRDYANLNSSRIPVTSVTGAGVIIDDTSAYVATVEVPTNIGPCTVILSRADAESPWLVSRFGLPEGWH